MSIDVTFSKLPGVLFLNSQALDDDFAFESFSQRDFVEATGLDLLFVQENHSRSNKGVLRGMHYQIQHPQGKLVRVLQGTIFNVVVDLRLSSPNFCQWDGVTLSAENHLQCWIPAGFAHGFLVVSESADVLYKTTDYRHPEFERSLLWSDRTVAVQWPIDGLPVLSARDKAGKTIPDAAVFR